MPRFSARSDRLEEAKRLRRLRHYLQISQRDLAQEFKVGHGAISFWESGMRTIPGPVLKLIEIYESELGLSPPPGGGRGKDLKKVSSSWISRNFQLSAVIARIAARLAENSFQKLLGGTPEPLPDMVAKKLGSTLGELKGLMMKVGQMMSYTDFGLPESAREHLAHLQDRSFALDREVIEAVFQEEMGRKPIELFQDWSVKPIGVGSIGQVHRARLEEGSEIAVKIQFPGISQSVGSDLQNTKAIDVMAPFLFRKQDGAAFPAEFKAELKAELRDRFEEECDYGREAAHQDEFHRIFRDDPQIVIPKIYPEFSRKRILASQLIEGKRFQEFLKESTEEERSRAGEIIFRMAFTSAFQHRILNCDPNPGNFLFLQDRVAFIDFGCVKALDARFVSLWRAYIRSILEQDPEASHRIVIEMGYVPNPKTFDFGYHYQMMKFLYLPWLEDKPFCFERGYVVQTWNKVTTENPNRSQISLPQDWIFVNRLQWGLYSILAILEAKANWRKIVLSLLYEPGEPLPAPLDFRTGVS